MAKLAESGKVSPEEIEAKVEEVARKMEILRVRYEQYFIGIEKVPPVTMRMEVARVIRELEQTKIKNTAIKFKMRTQIQKFTSYSTYWNRTLREIEDGTYRRQKDKMRRMAATAAETEAKSNAVVEVEPLVEDVAKVQAVADEAEDFLASLGLSAKPSKPAQAEVAQPEMVARPEAVVRKPSIVGASKPAIVIAKPASAQSASSPADSNPAIVRSPVIRPAAKPAIVQPAAKPAIVAAKPAVVQPAAPTVVRPAVVRPAAARPAIVQPAAPTAPRPAVVRPAVVRSANPAIVQPAAQESAPGAPKPPTFPPLKKS